MGGRDSDLERPENGIREPALGCAKDMVLPPNLVSSPALPHLLPIRPFLFSLSFSLSSSDPLGPRLRASLSSLQAPFEACLKPNPAILLVKGIMVAPHHLRTTQLPSSHKAFLALALTTVEPPPKQLPLFLGHLPPLCSKMLWAPDLFLYTVPETPHILQYLATHSDPFTGPLPLQGADDPPPALLTEFSAFLPSSPASI